MTRKLLHHLQKLSPFLVFILEKLMTFHDVAISREVIVEKIKFTEKLTENRHGKQIWGMPEYKISTTKSQLTRLKQRLFLFCLDLELFAKIEKRPGSCTPTEIGFLHFYEQLKIQTKQNLEHPFVDIVKQEMKILNSLVVGARPTFIFSEK